MSDSRSCGAFKWPCPDGHPAAVWWGHEEPHTGRTDWTISCLDCDEAGNAPIETIADDIAALPVEQRYGSSSIIFPR